MLPVVIALLAIFQLMAWWINARASSGTYDAWLGFLNHPAWSPPLGWWPWTTLAVVGVTVLVGVAVQELIRALSNDQRGIALES
jgi:hypothetical protein